MRESRRWDSGFINVGSVGNVGNDMSQLHLVTPEFPPALGGVSEHSRVLAHAAAERGLEVHVWTVNDPADMSRLLDVVVDGLVTDRADLAVPLAAARS